MMGRRRTACHAVGRPQVAADMAAPGVAPGVAIAGVPLALVATSNVPLPNAAAVSLFLLPEELGGCRLQETLSEAPTSFSL